MKLPEQPHPELHSPRLVPFETVDLNRKGEVIKQVTGETRQAAQELGGGVLLDLVEIPPGAFQMGSWHEGGYEDELPRHIVFLDSFWMGKYPVTQAQWQVVMGSLPDCRFHGPDRPVDTICWKDARAFCEKLSRRTGRQYDLPDEAQWEYACRAGTTTPFSYGETITTAYANYVGDHIYRDEPAGVYRHGTTPVGTFPPNPWGLHDMHGNVWEFCANPWTDDYRGAAAGVNSPPQTAPAAPQRRTSQIGEWFGRRQELIPARPEGLPHPGPGDLRVGRGGSWHETPGHCRSAVRLRIKADERLEYYGLRVILFQQPEPSPGN